MRPVRLLIPGEYWDSLIYKGLLFLFGRDGTIKTVDWDGLVHNLKFPTELGVVLECAFSKGSYLYGRHWALLLSDPDIKAVITLKFAKLSETPVEVSNELLNRYTVAEQDNRFSFPHNDAHVYYDHIYIASDDGISSAKCGKRTAKPVSRRVIKLTDCPALAFSAKYRALAIAAGVEGLYEFRLDNASAEEDSLRQLSKQSTLNSEWLYHNVLGSSDHGLVIAEFDNYYDNQSELRERKFRTLLHGKEVFEEDGFCWGNQDKLCQVHNQTLQVKRYNPFTGTEKHVEGLADLHSDFPESAVVSACVAAFGVVVELHDRVNVILSDGSRIVHALEPVNWRIFPSSVDYTNQLHIISDGYLQVESYNHDYFEKQESKVYGFYHSDPTVRDHRRKRPSPDDLFQELRVEDWGSDSDQDTTG